MIALPSTDGSEASAEALLRGGYSCGDEVFVDVEDGEFTLSKRSPEQ